MKFWTTKNGYQVTRLLGGRSNVFFVTNGKVNLVVDTSIGSMRKKLLCQIRQKNISHIDFLLLTHAHFDHAANAAYLKQLFNPKVLIHETESPYLKYGESIKTGGTNWFSRLIINIGNRHLNWLKYDPCDFDFTVGQMFDLSKFGFDAFILHTPGHTKGSVSLVVDNEIAIVGDCMFGIFKSTVLPPFVEDVPEMVRSWGKLLETGCRIFLPSHGEEKTRDQLLVEYTKKDNFI